MGVKKSERFPGIPGLPLTGGGMPPGSLDASPQEWVDPTMVDDAPTSRYSMPGLPPGYDWSISIEGTFVIVVLRRQHKPIRRASFHYTSDPYIVAAQAVVEAENILNAIGALTQVDLSCLDNFSPGVGVYVK